MGPDLVIEQLAHDRGADAAMLGQPDPGERAFGLEHELVARARDVGPEIVPRL
jgi:hypothetical protein